MLSAAPTLRRSLAPAAAGIAGGVATLALIGIPTDVVPNPWFERQTPVHAYDVAVLLALGLLAGALTATYALPGGAPGPRRLGFGSGALGWFAVGCPVCNKLVVALLGTSGATGVFGPVQPALGAVAVALAAAALVVRVRALRHPSCPVPQARPRDRHTPPGA